MLSSCEVSCGFACKIIKLYSVIPGPLTGHDLVKLLCIKVELMVGALQPLAFVMIDANPIIIHSTSLSIIAVVCTIISALLACAWLRDSLEILTSIIDQYDYM